MEDVDLCVSQQPELWHTAREWAALRSFPLSFHHLPIQVTIVLQIKMNADGLGLLCCPLSRWGPRAADELVCLLVSPEEPLTQSRDSKPSTQTDEVAGCESKAGE